MDFVILGLSITSSWGNGHATTYRALVRELNRRGHRILFLERDVPWYAQNRDLARPTFCTVALYSTLAELKRKFARRVRDADCVIVGSFVPRGASAGEWVIETAGGVTAFYDIDTPVTLSALENGGIDYLRASLIPRYQLYLSFTGGPTLQKLERRYGSPCARALYCAFDPGTYFPVRKQRRWDLGYMGTYSADRQPALEKLLIQPARKRPELRFVVAGAQFPPDIEWPSNVERLEHVAPHDHRAFYNRQRFTLNLTRRPMLRAGYSPSVRLFEAAGCATPVVSDAWPGISQFFTPGEEIVIARSAADVLNALSLPGEARVAIGRRARARALKQHTAAVRAAELEALIAEVRASRPGRRPYGHDRAACPVVS
jgi:spore maturation protein CgeB